ncbi:MAG: DUF4382 domain-containing protein [Chloroflexota bacterium]
MNRHDFDTALDECLDRVMAGETVQECLSRYPEWASQLRPLLAACLASREPAEGIPSLAGIQQARAAMEHARALRSTRSRGTSNALTRFLTRPVAVAGAASVAVIALTAFLLVPLFDNGSLLPSAPSDIGPDVSATPDADGNFAFLVSDQPNDISDFETLLVTIASVRLKPQDEGPWIEFTPELDTVDLTQLQGDRATEIWRGDIAPGSYVSVQLHVSHIEGILASTGKTVEVMLPSDTLRIASPFSVGESEQPVEFIFDITVHRTGGPTTHPRYILLPQAGESGAGRAFVPVDAADHAHKGQSESERTGNDAPAEEAVPPDDVGTVDPQSPGQDKDKDTSSDTSAPGPVQGDDTGRDSDAVRPGSGVHE